MIILTNFFKHFNFLIFFEALPFHDNKKKPPKKNPTSNNNPLHGSYASSFVEHAMCLVQVTEVTNYLTILTNFLSLKLLGGAIPPHTPGGDVPDFDMYIYVYFSQCQIYFLSFYLKIIQVI